METRDEILRTMAGAYKKATRKEKGRMLDHVVEVAGYNRAYMPPTGCVCTGSGSSCGAVAAVK